MGNPPVQVSLDNSSASGFDIKNLATAGANAFEGNTCLTSLNAPCSSVGPSITANPNPIPVSGNSLVGATTISWNAPDAQSIEIHIGSPGGRLFTQNTNRGSMATEVWVTDGMTFYLQDVTDGKPLTSDYTLATLVVNLQKSSAAGGPIAGGKFQPGRGFPVALFCGMLAWLVMTNARWRGKRPAAGRVAVLCAVGISCVPAALSQTQSLPGKRTDVAALDRMTAEGRSQQEIAKHLFDTQGCRDCHTAGKDGKLGFTDAGMRRAKNFEGCISMLTSMTVIVQLPAARLSPEQRQRAKQFEEFGCTTCHVIAPGKLGLTEMGAKLTRLHLGCVDLEKTLAVNSSAAR